MSENNNDQARGREAEQSIGSLLRYRGRAISLARVRQGRAAEPFDILVDGKPIKIKTASMRGGKSSPDFRQWTFNIHRHGVVKETGLFGYILRLENFPGSRKAVHVFLRAPLERPTIVITLRSFLMNPEFYEGVQNFEKLAKGELTEELVATPSR